MTEHNADLLIDVADVIEDHPRHFDMGSYWGDYGWKVTGTPAECGTTGCIAGWAATLTGFRLPLGMETPVDGRPSLYEHAREALGLTHKQAHCMFIGWMGKDPETIAADLRDIAKGELVWDGEDWR